jgi:hypothetical protein
MRSTSKAAEYGRKFATNVVIPLVEFAAAVGGQLFFWTHSVAQYRVHGALAVGVSPASNLTTNLPQSVITSFDKVFIENLKANTPWVRCTARRTLDENSGNKLVLFMYQNLAAPASPPTQAPEGTIQTGLTVSVVQNTSTIGNYADYANISTYAIQTAIDPALEALGVQMAYRLAQVVNIIIQATADGASVVDALVNHVPLGTNLVAQDITSMVQSLGAVNALPFANGRFTGVIHPFIVGDILISTQPNGITDVLKRTAEGQEKLRELPAPDGDEVTVIDWGGCSFHQSTLVKLTVGAPNKLRTYVVGRDGVIGISFGAKENTQIGDGDWRNLNVWVRRLTEPSGYDPSRMIGGFASYNTMYTATLPPDPVQRIRYCDAASAIT